MNVVIDCWCSFVFGMMVLVAANLKKELASGTFERQESHSEYVVHPSLIKESARFAHSGCSQRGIALPG